MCSRSFLYLKSPSYCLLTYNNLPQLCKHIYCSLNLLHFFNNMFFCECSIWKTVPWQLLWSNKMLVEQLQWIASGKFEVIFFQHHYPSTFSWNISRSQKQFNHFIETVSLSTMNMWIFYSAGSFVSYESGIL